MSRVSKRAVRWSMIVLISLVVGGFSGIVAGYLRTAPSLDEIHFNPDLTTYIYDRNGQVISRLYKENRSWAPLSEIPLDLQHAIVSIEDERFYEHHGIDLRGTFRALWSDIMPGGPLQGGSTITQQLAQQAFLTLDRTWSTKLKKFIWAIQIERKYSKAEILDAYLNIVYFGGGAHGVETASELYYDKPVSDLDLAQCAMLAALPNSPNYYSPFDHPKVAIQHRNIVLDKMYEQGYITQAQRDSAKAEPLNVVDQRHSGHDAQYFVSYVLQKLIDMYGEQQVYTGGLKVYTTLDLNMQKAGHQALDKDVAQVPTRTDAKGVPQPEYALLSMDAHTGGILAMIGGRGEDHYNRALDALRQPGSAIKPFIYTAAL
ncbi:MAG TPA: transglycosylase domain-containing protein, partial [Limnochordia bacterium]|nr:transglycosylase domain-containing protein [Limnochordia bacterium]